MCNIVIIIDIYWQGITIELAKKAKQSKAKKNGILTRKVPVRGNRSYEQAFNAACWHESRVGH